MKNDHELRKLAEQYGVKVYNRRFIDVKGGETRFVDLPKPRKDLVDELREAGAFRDSS